MSKDTITPEHRLVISQFILWLQTQDISICKDPIEGELERIPAEELPELKDKFAEFANEEGG